MIKTKFRTNLGPLRPASRRAFFFARQVAAPPEAKKPAPPLTPVPPVVRPPAEALAGNEPLFRQRALDAASNHWAGTIVLAAKVPMRVAGSVALALLLAIGALLGLGHYTRTVSVTGQMVPSAGSIRVVANQFGRVTRRPAQDGAHVRAGQLLYELSAERAGSGGGVDARIGQLLTERRRELAHAGELQVQDMEQRAAGLASRERSLRAEVATRHEAVALQAIQVRSAQARHGRFRELARRGFVSQAQLADARDAVTALTGRQKALESDVLAVQRELLSVEDEARLIGTKVGLIRSQSAQQLASIGQEAAEHEGRSRMQVLAPAAGVVTALAFEQGQAVPPGATMATILPAGSELEAHLMVPSRAVGFIASGQRVRLRMSAFPFQKFGQVEGTVARVERSPIAEGQSAGAEPVYRVTVRLATQAVSAYGRTQHFKAGMTLEADILQDRRRLIEWVVEPLISAAKSRAG
ncbi:MAG: HlyD family efflux transporter periplasmic adaptor subunit [Pseudomonadota bacterium]